MIRGYLVRKVINKVNVINDSLNNFLFIIAFSIKKKYFYFLKKHDSVAPPPGGKRLPIWKIRKFSNKKIAKIIQIIIIIIITKNYKMENENICPGFFSKRLYRNEKTKINSFFLCFSPPNFHKNPLKTHI